VEEPGRGVEPVQCEPGPVDGARNAAFAQLSATARQELAATGSARALHAGALLDLSFQPTTSTLDRVIARLGEVRERTGDNADVLNHLAVAHAARADVRDDPFDLLVALDWAVRATAADPENRAASFNRALLLDRLHLVASAQAAWASMVAGDDEAGWARETTRRASELAGEWDIARWSDELVSALEPGAPAIQLDRLAGESPQHARQEVVQRTLVEWAEAHHAGDTASARRALDHSRVLAQAGTRTNNDSSALAAVTAVDRARPVVARRMAHGVAAWGRGRALFQSGRFDEAAPAFALAIQSLDDVPVLRDWAEVYAAVTRVYEGTAGSLADARSRLSAVVDANADSPYPSLRARAAWALAFAQGRSGDLVGAVETAGRATAVYDAIRERENLGGILFLSGEASTLIGNDLAGRRDLFRALRELRSFRNSSFRHNLLLHYGLYLAGQGYPHASLAMHAEDARIAQHTGRARDPVEALTWLARSQIEAGFLDMGSASLAAALAALPLAEPASSRDRLEVEIARGEGELRLGEGDAAAAVPLLGRVIAYFDAHQNAALLLPVLASRAAAHLLLDDTASAEADLAHAIENFEARAPKDDGPGRLLFESVAPVYDAVLDIHAKRNHVLPALAWLERSRPGAHRVAGADRADSAALAKRARDLPAGRVVLVWAMLPERTLLWAITRDSIRLHTIDRPAARMEALVERFENLLRSVDDTAAAASTASELYALLIAPAAAALEGRNQIVLVPDRALDRIPFAALRDDSAHYLVQRFVLRHAPDVAMALDAEGGASGRFVRPLLVSDPAYRPQDFPGLPSLRSAAAEVAAIARMFPDASTLAGAEATASRLREQIGSHDLLHFAGHARFRSDRPDLSYLVLARDSAGSVLRAADIAGLDLRGLRLVILSACATHAASDARSAFGGLSHAFLAAGARGVVGSLWEADDEATAALMENLHSAVAAGRSPAAALQSAQKRLIESSSTRLRAPASWATFRFEGR
jgi:CHAT domain-containing protein/tetratricopeptide (TPR) repeat protein